MAVEVLKIADDAERTLPGRAAALVLKGRALVQVGRYAEATTALRDARARDDRALDEPFALFAWARALSRSGHAAEAIEAYRTLLPRASTLTLADRAAASIEAGMLAMAQGPTGIDRAVPIFRQALRDAQDVTQTVAVLTLALALDRAGDGEEARALLAERAHGDPRPVLATPRARDLLGLGAETEGHALAALALEATDPAAARASWQRYVEAAGKGPWVDHARTHEGGAARRRRPAGGQP
jgi:tetratricopeptide (TPR) repeat protein